MCNGNDSTRESPSNISLQSIKQEQKILQNVKSYHGYKQMESLFQVSRAKIKPLAVQLQDNMRPSKADIVAELYNKISIG